MKNVNIQKSHYEIVTKLFEKTLPFTGHSFDSFAEETNTLFGPNPTYAEFVKEPLLKTLAEKAGDNPQAQSSVITMANVLYHVYLMNRNHERIYYITPSLAVNLAHTELNVDTRFLKSPFPEIYIQIDPGLFYIADPVQPDLEQPVRGFYVNIREVDGKKQVRIVVCALRTNYSEISNTNDDSIFYFKIILGDGKVKDELEAYMDDSIYSKQDELKQYGGHYNLSKMKELFFFVFNCLMYITSKDADIINQLPFNFNKVTSRLKSKSKIKKMMKRQSKSSSLPILIVGSQELSPYKIKTVREAGGIGKWKLEKRVYVSGYWRVQWYGSDKDNTKRYEIIFIKPYTKGPELADVIKKRYQVS